MRKWKYKSNIFKIKTKEKIQKNPSKLHTNYHEKYNNLQHQVLNNNTKFKTNQQYFNYNTNIEELKDFKKQFRLRSNVGNSHR